MRNRIVLAVLAGALLASPLAGAQTGEELTKQQLIERSGRICKNLVEASTPHARAAQRAADENRVRGVIRHGRRFIRTSRPYVRRLGELRPAASPDRYRNFVGQTRAALNWLDSALDALAARRGRLAKRRLETSDRHAARAEGAARRYPLRRACIGYVD